MKTLITAALIAALALCTAGAGAREPGQPDAAPAKPAGKKVTAQELGEMLQAMGLETKPINDKDGKLTGHVVKYQSEGWTIVGEFEVLADGRIWLRGWFSATVDEKTPAAVVLALLDANSQVFPARVLYNSKGKTFLVFVEVANGNVTPALLRASIDQFTTAVKTTLTAYNTAKAKAAAVEKAKAEEQGKK